jgi:hypothetical protein
VVALLLLLLLQWSPWAMVALLLLLLLRWPLWAVVVALLLHQWLLWAVLLAVVAARSTSLGFWRSIPVPLWMQADTCGLPVWMWGFRVLTCRKAPCTSQCR